MNFLIQSLILSLLAILSGCSGMANKAQIQVSIDEIEWHSETRLFDDKAKDSLTLWISKHPARDLRIKLDSSAKNYSAIKQHLLNQGLRTQQIESFAQSITLPPKHNFIAGLVIIRSIPKCPSWVTPNMADSKVRQSSNFGCASERNLAIMVADPSDLIRGKELESASSEHSINALSRYYRRPEIQAAPAEDPEPLIAPVISNN